MDGKLEDMEQTSDKLASQINVTLSLTHQLPSELVADIFELAINESGQRALGVVKSVIFKFGQVCGRWRSILHATPALWTSLVLDFTNRKSIPWTIFTDEVVS
ncbi:hypothetical protein CONPUDRAFT_161883 [Coniophora puteana RWD-64-598 SS2]|uniref:Uncharacterized protein n=1 Tax=Coniophora puteana (strain RWD-64-598) TaxID=741705 RepID=A0A5M3N7N3_CONPW|nr:uncharacterized protein CONPUDRAFT_161883 [Coniophora puteana RWD-64-598 SS2]EIW87316.1 hypothetical protein CONPUDRAFT_161883 [Coniophora puteana RWD-64-598 SS2]